MLGRSRRLAPPFGHLLRTRGDVDPLIDGPNTGLEATRGFVPPLKTQPRRNRLGLRAEVRDCVMDTRAMPEWAAEISNVGALSC
jgi:hypothetical protein